MPTKCLGHECVEARYRAVVTNWSVWGQTPKCPGDGDIIKAITDAWAEDAHEEEHCDARFCNCTMPDWPDTWTMIEQGVTYDAVYFNLDCKAHVSITYDWQYQERSAKCYRKAPVKGPG